MCLKKKEISDKYFMYTLKKITFKITQFEKVRFIKMNELKLT